MNYIPVDVSCVKELFDQGRTVYDRIHPVKDLREAQDAARAGRLFIKCEIFEDELQEYLDTVREIERLQDKAAETQKKLISESQLALADKPFRTFELTTARGESLSITHTSKLVVEDDKLEVMYKQLGEDEGPIEKVISYKPNSAFKNNVRVLVGKEFLQQPELQVAESILTRCKIEGTAEQFLHKIGKTYATRVKRMQKLYGMNRADASDFAYMLLMAQNWENFQDFFNEVGNGIQLNEFMNMLDRNCKVSGGIAIRTKISE